MIPSTLLESFQQFFDARLDNVRVNTGSALPALCGARAMAWNEHIWIADPDPDFASSDIVRMLAHEYTHICQQRRASTQHGKPDGVGKPEDPLEREADACADAFLAAGRCPPITADSAGKLRRVLSIVPGTAKLTVDFGRARPRADFALANGSRTLVCHLTNGFTDMNNIADALFWAAETAVRSGSSDPAELRTLRFGFLQFMRVDALSFSYSGRTPADGEVVINPLAILPVAPFLDSLAGANPFTNDIDLPVARGIATARSGDHPALRAPTQLVNRATNANNFLLEVVDRRRFWTVFTAQRRSPQSFQHLAHHSWELTYRFQFIWQAGIPRAAFNQSSLQQVDPVTPGPPSEAALSSLLIAPTGPLANDVTRAAITAAAIGPIGRTDLNTRVNTNPPPNFFT
jgi:hypothetical protein